MRMRTLLVLINLLFVLMAKILPISAGDKEIITWDKFYSRFQWGLHCTLWFNSNNNVSNPNIYYDGPNSPFVTYLKEMHMCGFSGILIQIFDTNPIHGADGKWKYPDERIKQIHDAVQEAVNQGYYVILEVNPINYSILRDAKNLTHEEKLTDNSVPIDYDVWTQVISNLKDIDHVAYRTTNEFHGYKYEQTLDPSNPDYLTRQEANKKFFKYIIKKGEIVRRIKPTAWVFYRNGGQLVGDMVALPYPLGIDPEPTEDPCYYGISHNFNAGDFSWGYWGLNDPYYTRDFLKYARINRKPIPIRESAGLLADFMENNHIGAVANRFATEYHFPVKKYGDRAMTDFQMLAQLEFILDFFREHKSTFTYADGDTSCGMKQCGIFNTIRMKPNTYNVPHLDEFMHLLLEKSNLRKLHLKSTPGGKISHSLGEPYLDTFMCRIGDKITLNAVPEPGYEFTGWQGSATSMANPLNITIPDAHGTIYATFAHPGEPTPHPEIYAYKRHWDSFGILEHCHVDKAEPDTNFSQAEHLVIRPINKKVPKSVMGEKRAFLKFNIDKLPVDPNSIVFSTIKFYTEGNTCYPFISVHNTDASWDPKTLTWNNQPEIGVPLSTSDYSHILQYRVHLNITDYIKKASPGIHSFCVTGELAKIKYVDFEIYTPKNPQDIKTVDQPLLYVVWDEKIPVDAWDTPAPKPNKAIQTSPDDGQMLVSNHVSLKWKNAGNSKNFDIYLGKSDKLTRIHTQNDAKYDDFDLVYSPKDLLPNSTYYWKIDAINKENTKTAGDIRSFSIPLLLTNYATPSIEPQNSKLHPDFAIDKNPGTSSLTEDKQGSYWQMEMDRDYEICSIYLTSKITNWGRTKNLENCIVKILDSSGNTIWTGEPFVSKISTKEYLIPANTIGRVVRVQLPTGVKNTMGNYKVDLQEIEVWGHKIFPPQKAVNVFPSDKQTNVDIQPILKWMSGGGATNYDVYFGTVNPPPFIGNQKIISFNTETLNFNTKYYWRIDSINKYGKTQGDVWSFTTSPQNFSVKGTITGDVIAGVTVAVNANRYTTTDVNGSYTINGLVDGIYTVSPSIPGYIFTPPNSAINVAGSDVSGVDFVSIKNTETQFTLTVNNGTGSGRYEENESIVISAEVPKGQIFNKWQGDNQYVEDPTAASTTVTMPPLPIAITATFKQAPPDTHTISGTISGDVVNGITVAVDNVHSAITNLGGAYAISGLANGSYTATPTLAGYTFTPANTNVIVADADISDVNFVSDKIIQILAVDDSYNLETGENITIPKSEGVLANDLNTEHFTVSLKTPPANGTLTLEKDGSFSYISNKNFSGKDTFIYQLDGITPQNTAKVTLVISPFKITIGSTVHFNASEVTGLKGDSFAKPPKIYGLLWNNKKSSLRKIKSSTTKDFSGVWSKKTPLYDKKSLKTTGYEIFFKTSGALKPQNIKLFVKGKTISKTLIDEHIKTVRLVPPVFSAFKDGKGKTISSAKPGASIIIEGAFFGEKTPKVGLRINGKLLKCKVDKKAFSFTNHKGKSSPMDPETGNSQLKIILPVDIPKGTYPLIIDNKIGIATTPFVDKNDKGHLPELNIE